MVLGMSRVVSKGRALICLMLVNGCSGLFFLNKRECKEKSTSLDTISAEAPFLGRGHFSPDSNCVANCSRYILPPMEPHGIHVWTHPRRQQPLKGGSPGGDHAPNGCPEPSRGLRAQALRRTSIYSSSCCTVWGHAFAGLESTSWLDEGEAVGNPSPDTKGAEFETRRSELWTKRSTTGYRHKEREKKESCGCYISGAESRNQVDRRFGHLPPDEEMPGLWWYHDLRVLLSSAVSWMD